MSGHDKTGKQRYKCVNCGHKFVENPTQQKFTVWEKECPRCGHIGARKAGKTSGKQYYQCLECNHKYLENPCYKHVSPKQKQFIIRYGVNLGVSVKDLKPYVSCTERTIRNILSKYKIIRKKYVRSKEEIRQDLMELNKYIG